MEEPKSSETPTLSRVALEQSTSRLDHAAGPAKAAPAAPAEKPATTAARKPVNKKPFVITVLVLGAVLSAIKGWPVIWTLLTTISTDDAYVDGHVTLVAPRVSGQIIKVLVDDNNRVKRGDILVQLDPEPYRVQVAIRQAAVAVAEADLAQAHAQVRALVGQTHANRYTLENTMQRVNEQAANLKAQVATYNSHRAQLELTRRNDARAEKLAPSGAISNEDLDVHRQQVKVDEALVEQALQTIYADRAGLGLATEPPPGHELSEVPADLDQNFSVVRATLAKLIESDAQLGYYATSLTATPREAVAAFSKQDPDGDLDRIYARLIPNAPPIKQAEARLLQARRDLEEAELNLSYCNVVSEIDGVVTRRNVNPGKNVQAGEELMAVRSLTEIWINANFKETQLADLRIGQRVRCELDMYGGRRDFEGRITGFTMGTGQTLSLLPAQNATGNFVKIVQRLPVRIELTDYNPDEHPLFVGLSAVPHVYYKEPASGPHAGAMLQANLPLPQAINDPKPSQVSTESPGTETRP
ncbi:MAG: HlyD family secretion protein [Pirellula sp.]|nr:HlyD family secretion protein [Pirellula sp.]